MVLPVPVPTKYKAPVNVLVIPVDARVKLLCIDICAVPAQVTLPDAGPDKLKSAHRAATSIVTVYAVALDPELKITVSIAVGMAAPLPEPLVVDQ